MNAVVSELEASFQPSGKCKCPVRGIPVIGPCTDGTSERKYVPPYREQRTDNRAAGAPTKPRDTLPRFHLRPVRSPFEYQTHRIGSQASQRTHVCSLVARVVAQVGDWGAHGQGYAHALVAFSQGVFPCGVSAGGSHVRNNHSAARHRPGRDQTHTSQPDSEFGQRYLGSAQWLHESGC